MHGNLKSRGFIINERLHRRITLQRVTAGFAALLTVILLLYAIIPAPPPRPALADPTIACASGELKIVGSNVFMPVVPAVAAEYSRVCGEARISTQATGSIQGRGQESGTRALFEKKVLGATEGILSSDKCQTRDRDPRAPTIRCERTSNAEVVREISQTLGAIGYADAPSVAEARKTNALRALILDGKVFDVSADVNSGDPFWTVKYLYTRTVHGSDTLLADFGSYLRKHKSSRSLLKDAGYLPCTASDGTRLVLCN